MLMESPAWKPEETAEHGGPQHTNSQKSHDKVCGNSGGARGTWGAPWAGGV